MATKPAFQRTKTILAESGDIVLYRFGTSYNVEQPEQPTKHYMTVRQGLTAFKKRLDQQRKA